MSLYSTKSNFKSKGPKLWCLPGSSDDPQAAILLPQKFPLAKQILASLLGTYFTSYAHLLANLIADSTPSQPVFINKALSYPKVSCKNY